MALIEKEVGGIQVLAADHPGIFFTTRLGGVSKSQFFGLNLGYFTGDHFERVDENRQAVSEALAISSSWISGHQVHGRDVLIADHRHEATRTPRVQADAVVSDLMEKPIAVLTADCVPIALASSSKIAAVHSGWRGLCAGVIENVMERFDGEMVRAWIGPSIGPCHYEVGIDVVESFRNARPDAPDFSSKGSGIMFDLRAAAGWILERSGASLADDQPPPCTFCDERFFSYRRDGVTGRQGLIAWKT